MAPRRCPCPDPRNQHLLERDFRRCDSVRGLALGRLPGGPLVIRDPEPREAMGRRQRSGERGQRRAPNSEPGCLPRLERASKGFSGGSRRTQLRRPSPDSVPQTCQGLRLL